MFLTPKSWMFNINSCKKRISTQRFWHICRELVESVFFGAQKITIRKKRLVMFNKENLGKKIMNLESRHRWFSSTEKCQKLLCKPTVAVLMALCWLLSIITSTPLGGRWLTVTTIKSSFVHQFAGTIPINHTNVNLADSSLIDMT